MGSFVRRLSMWRKALSAAAAVLAALVTLVALGKGGRPPADEPRELTLDQDFAARASVVRADLARAASLWIDGLVFECRVPAQYDQMDSAQFIAVASVAATESGAPALSVLYPPRAEVRVERTATFAVAA